MDVATLVTRGFDHKTRTVHANTFGIRYSKARKRHLKPPYTTMCKDYSSTDCITDCVNEELISLFDPLSPISNHLKGKRKLVTGLFLNSNTTYATKFLESTDKCRLKCPWNECGSFVMVTSYGEISDWKDFAPYQMLPNTASISIENHAKIVFIEYFPSLMPWNLVRIFFPRIESIQSSVKTRPQRPQ